jgi:mevalonate kinase
MSLRKTSATASAPGKIILFGEHFVVYGSHAILASINKRIKVNVSLNKNHTINIMSNLGIIGSYKDSEFTLVKGGKKAKVILDLIFKCVSSVLSERKQNLGININLISDIPYGVGLGSSAACCVATVAAVDSLFREPNKQWICVKAVECERLVHKNSSGADCYISVFGGIMYYVKDEEFKKIKAKKDSTMIIVNTRMKHSTGDLVSLVKKLRDQNVLFFIDLTSHADNICQQALTTIKNGDEKKLGDLMTENHALLQQIGVSNRKIDRAIQICIKNGALGAKLTGAGGGGSIIALIPNEKKMRVISEIEKNRFECFPVKFDYNGLITY